MAKVTSKDIAKAAGVSQTTVSFVLSGRQGVSIAPETREKVLSAARRLGYRYRAGAAQARRLTIGLMVPTLSNLYYPFLLQSVELEAAARGAALLIMNTLRDPKNEQAYLDYIASGTVDGILSLFTPRAAIQEDQPLVIVGEKQPGIPVDTVSLNSSTAGYMMADHMISLGHQHIAYISSAINNITQARRYRMEGVHARMAESDLSQNLKVYIGEDERELSDTAYEFNCGWTLTRRMMAEAPQITAIIAVNDMTAAGCMACLNERGVAIPGRMAVGGFDNLLTSRMLHPPLTSVDQLASHGCKVGLDILLDKISGGNRESVPIKMEYQPQLIVRGSTLSTVKEQGAND